MEHSDIRKLCVSVDLDSIASHLRGYQINDSNDVETIYSRAIPRILEIFDRCRVVATFFVVAAEGLNFRNSLQALLGAGHEIASHSLTHPQNFNDLPEEALRKELLESKRRLETELEHCDVLGFRAPSWGLGEAQLAAIAAAGYKYDASLIPSWVMPLLRLMISLRSTESSSAAKIWRDWRNVWADRVPQQVDTADGALLRIPVATSPLLRLPHYHTLSYLMPPSIFRLNGALAAFASPCLSYVLHAVDFLEMADVVDPRIERHPGMRMPLQEKLTAIEQVLTIQCRKARAVSLRALLSHQHPPDALRTGL